MKKIIGLSIFLLLNFMALGQDTPATKTLYLKDGSFLLGHLVKEKRASYLWQLTDGTQILLQKKQVRRIEASHPDYYFLKRGKIKRNKGFFSSLMVGRLHQEKMYEGAGPNFDYSINLSVNYQLNTKLAVGLGTGYDIYNTPIIPLYLNFQGDLFNSATTPFYRISAGYGFVNPTKMQKDNQNLEQSGGVLFHPSVGIKFHTRSNLAWLIDFGYRVQRYNRRFVWEENPQRWTLQRISFRIGIEF